MWRHFAIFLGLTLSVFGDAFFDKTFKEAWNGNASAQFLRGIRYANGDGVLKDDVKALKWIRKSAEQGNDTAQFHLGRMCANGEGEPKDLVEAHVWFTLAGAKGDEGGRKALTLRERNDE